jgi:hypothetical protein
MAVPICRIFEAHAMRVAASRAPFRAGNSIEIKSAMMPITTRSSTRVKPRPRVRRRDGLAISPPAMLSAKTFTIGDAESVIGRSRCGRKF